ncbi:hypothetical protein PMAYCL1PPCAC_21534, partial [Pristionchus mayeri]
MGGPRPETSLVVRQISRSGGELGVALDDLVDCLEEVLLGGDLPAGTNREHARLRAHRTDLRTCGVGAETCQQIVSDVALDAHLFSVDLEDVRTSGKIWQRELDLPVESSGSHEGGVEGVGTVSRHEHLDVSAGVESVELVDQLEHRTLH